MKTSGLIALALTLALGLCAVAHSQEGSFAGEVMSELSERSKLPEDELRRLTADCAAGQQAMYFCAYRDLVAAELKLQRVVTEKERQFPACQVATEARVARWKPQRDEACARSAAKAWGGGSMEPTARNLCLADSTGRMVEQMQRMNTCPRR